MTYLAVDNS